MSSDSDDECLAEDIHLSILRGDGNWPGYDAQLLFGETIFPVCSPEYFAKHPEISELSNLAQHSLIGVASTHTEWMNWHTWLSHNGLHVKKLDQTVLFNTYPLSIDAAANGLAIGDCTSDDEKQVDPRSKVKRYKMDPVAERTLQRFFAPYNKKLVAVLGYDPGWGAGAEE